MARVIRHWTKLLGSASAAPFPSFFLMLLATLYTGSVLVESTAPATPPVINPPTPANMITEPTGVNSTCSALQTSSVTPKVHIPPHILAPMAVPPMMNVPDRTILVRFVRCACDWIEERTAVADPFDCGEGCRLINAHFLMVSGVRKKEIVFNPSNEVVAAIPNGVYHRRRQTNSQTRIRIRPVHHRRHRNSRSCFWNPRTCRKA